MYIEGNVVNCKKSLDDETRMMLNLKSARSIYIEQIQCSYEPIWFGNELVIEYPESQYCLMRGYSDECIQAMYNNILSSIDDERTGVLNIDPVKECELYRVNIETYKYPKIDRDYQKLEFIGNKLSKDYLKKLFQVRECVDERGSSLTKAPGFSCRDYAIYLYKQTSDKYIQASSAYGYMNDTPMNKLFETIDMLQPEISFGKIM